MVATVALVDDYEMGQVDQGEAPNAYVEVPGIGGCSSGLVTVEIHGNVEFFAFHDQQSSERAKAKALWPHEAFAEWWRKFGHGSNPRSSLVYSTQTDTIRAIKAVSEIKEANSQTLLSSYGNGRVPSFPTTVMIDSNKTFTYNLDHQTVTVRDERQTYFSDEKTLDEYRAWLRRHWQVDRDTTPPSRPRKTKSDFCSVM